MFKVSATSVDASVQTLAKAGDQLKNTPYENLNIFKSAQQFGTTFSMIITEKICYKCDKFCYTCTHARMHTRTRTHTCMLAHTHTHSTD